MRSTAFLVFVCLMTVDIAWASDRAHIISYGKRSAPGVQSSANAYEGTLPETEATAAEAHPQASDMSFNQIVSLAKHPTNRCMATNFGEGFSYSFANGVEC